MIFVNYFIAKAEMMKKWIFLSLLMSLVFLPVHLFSATSNPEDFIKDSFIDENGDTIEKIYIPPSRPPKNYDQAMPQAKIFSSSVILSVPAFDWSYGCSPTSGAMLAGYYDRNGYPNLYTGPANNGIVPLNNSVWGSGECPVSATHIGIDNRNTRGNVDDYWITYNNLDSDPYITDNVTAHAHDCVADFMGTSRSEFSAPDGGSWLYCSGSGYATRIDSERDICDGIRRYFNYCGYTVFDDYSQRILGQGSDPSLGFTLEQYRQEIDAGRPVIIHVYGHTMIGVGYEPGTTTIYIHNTWDYSTHTMTWGDSYSGMQHYAVSVIQTDQLNMLSASPATMNFTAGINENNPGNQSATVSFSMSGTYTWTAEAPLTADWLTLSGTSGGNGDDFSVLVDITGLSAGTYTADIELTSADAGNSPLNYAVQLTVEPEPASTILAELSAAGSFSLPNSGWEIVENDNATCVTPIISMIGGPDTAYQLDYSFTVPAGVAEVYIFAEVDANNNGNDDSYFVQLNGSSSCTWNGLQSLPDSWQRSWVYNQGQDQQHAFPVTAGTNTISLFPREDGGFVHWLVVTTDPDYEIENHIFEGGEILPPEPTPAHIIVSQDTVHFSTIENGATPSQQSITVSNSGETVLGWTATKPGDCNWLTLTNSSGSDNDIFLLDASIQGIPVGTCSAIITIADPDADNMTVEIPVLLTIDPTPVPEITVTPTALSFSAVENGSNPAVQRLTITNSGDGTLNWDAAVVAGNDWATINPVSGNDNSVVSVTVDISGLSADTYSGSIEISDAAAGNTPVTVPIILTIESVPEPTGEILAEFEAEESVSLPENGWIVLTNEGANCVQADVNCLAGPNANYQLDYTFTVPNGVSQIYIFAELDVNGTGSDDSFWITLNDDDKCKWNNLSNLGDGWNQQWVFDLGNDTQHSFAVTPGSNTLNLYPRETGGNVNWLVVTTNPNLDIHNYVFDATPPEPIISVNPGELAFSAITGSGSLAGQILTVANSGTGTLDWTATKINTSTWLNLSTTTGTDDDQITVSVDITSLTAGVYQDTIQIIDSNADNSPVNIPVSLTLTAPVPTIVINPENLNFTALVNGTTPAAQTLTISNSGTGSLNWNAAKINAAAWLNLSTTTGSDNAQISVSVDITSLTAGVYQDTIQIIDTNAENSPVNAAVTLTLAAPVPTIVINPENLSFTGLVNGTTPAAQSLTISNSGTGTLNWTAVKINAAAWLNLSTTTGADDALITVSVDITSLTAGVYQDTIQIIDTNAENSPVNVPITLTLTTPIPTITITPESLSFTALINGATPAAQALTISNSGTGDLNWIADCLNTPAWLSLTNTSGTNSGAVTVNVVLSGLTAGTYSDTIRVRDENASNSPVTVPVTLTISDTSPELAVTPQTLTFSAMENGANPAAQAVSISNIGTGTINWDAVKTNNAVWLTIAPNSGNGSGSISVMPNISALAPGTFTETIQIIDTLAVNSPQNVSVTLTVSAEPTGPTVAEFNAEASTSLPKTGWQTVENEGSTCIMATVNDLSGANAAYQLDYEFTVADGVTEVYVFAELDVNGTGDDDSFWITLNGGDRCKWNNLSNLGDGWNQQWVFNLSVDTQHTFPVTPGVNTLSLFPREDGGYVNWLVVTTDPNEDIHNYEFGGGTPPPPPVPQISVNPSSLVFAGLTGETPAAQNITISNSGTGTLSWTAAKAGGSGWFTINNTAGISGGSISIDINSTGLAAGTYADNIIITDPNAVNSPVSVPVSLTLTEPAPVIAVNPTSLQFEATTDGDNPASQTVTVSNSGTGTFNWDAAEIAAYTWLNVTNSSGTAGEQFSVTIDNTGLVEGDYTGNIRVSAVNAVNGPVDIAVTLTVSDQPPLPEDAVLAQFQAENSSSLPNSGWRTSINESSWALIATVSSTSSPNEAYRVDYTFEVPAGISTVYIFGEVDPSGSYKRDAFYVKMNNGTLCSWSSLKYLGANWAREWVYNVNANTQQAFPVTQGTNTISLYPRDKDSCINWLVVTFDANYDITNHVFSETALSLAKTTDESENLWKEAIIEIPENYQLGQNYPNPFNPSTRISFDLPEAAHVTLNVYNVRGQQMQALINGQRAAGHHEVTFDATNLPAGTYFYRLAAKQYQSIRKMALIK